MIQAPIQNYGMQQQATPVQYQQQRPGYAPSYNAVQINLDTPTLNAPPAMPYYPPVNMQYPSNQQQPQTQPNGAVVQQQPEMLPQPQIGPQQPANVPPVQVVPPVQNNTDEIVNKAFTGLNSSDYDTQALALEEIAKKGLEKQEDAVPYLQENIFDKLIEIMNTDTSKLAGPTDKQIEIRDKMAQNDKAIEDTVKAGKDASTAKLPFKLTAVEEQEANRLSPYEQAERNKEYALFTTAILQKTYADELKKQTGSTPPITELPGSKAVITVLKTSDEPNMAVAAIDALRYVQRPEYKEDLTTLYTIAQNDSRESVSQAATEALVSLNEIK